MPEITSTSEMAEAEWDGDSEPGEVGSDIVATTEPEGRGIEFNVSMRSYTMRDMDALIVEAAAQLIVGRRGERQMAQAIEQKCIELIDAKARKALEAVTTEIVDQPITPTFGDKKPTTMREFIGLTGREYLSERVDRNGRPRGHREYSDYGDHFPRLEWLARKAMEEKFKAEIEKATNTAIVEVRAAVKAKHEALIAAEKARLAEALAKLTT